MSAIDLPRRGTTHHAPAILLAALCIFAAVTGERTLAVEAGPVQAQDATVVPGSAAALDRLLVRLYGSSHLDSLIAGALISQHLASTGGEPLAAAYPPEGFFTLALALDAEDPALLFVIADYCLGPAAAADPFCREGHFGDAFARVEGDNGIAWAMAAASAQRQGRTAEADTLLARAGEAPLFTDFWPELLLILLSAFQESEYSATLLNAYQAAFQSAPQAFRIYGDLLLLCGGKAESSAVRRAGCHELGRKMQASSSLATTVVGLTIEAEAVRRAGEDPTQVTTRRGRINLLSARLARLLAAATGDPVLLERYLAAAERDGEIQALADFGEILGD